MLTHTGHKPSSTWGYLPSVILLAFTILCLSCAGTTYKDIRLLGERADAQAGLSMANPVPIRIAVASVVSPKETRRTYNDLIAYLGEKLGRPTELVQRQTYAEINDLVHSGGVDVAFVCGGAYIEGEREFGMELLAAPQIRSKTVYFSYLIVLRNSDFHKLSDLRGKIFAFADPLSNSGRLAPSYALWKIGEVPASFFRKFVFTYSHDNSIQAVVERLVDGAAVDSLVYQDEAAQNSLVSNKTRVIERWGPYGNPPVVVNPRLNGILKEQIRTILTGMAQDDGGRKILGSLMIDRFVPTNKTAYESLREMARAVRWTQ